MIEDTNLDDIAMDNLDIDSLLEYENEDEDEHEEVDLHSLRRLSRSTFAQMATKLKTLEIMNGLAANEKIAMVYSPIASPDDLIPIILAEKESCFNIALRYAEGDRDAADDLYQLALFKAVQNLKSGRPYLVSQKAVKRIQLDDEQAVDLKVRRVIVRNPVAWLHTIIRNTGRNEYLRRRKMMVILRALREDFERESRRFEMPEMVVLRNLSNIELHGYVNSLPEQFSKIINLHYFEGLSYEEIAKELKCPPSTVRVSAMRALVVLKDVLLGKRDVINGRIGRPKTLENCCSLMSTGKKVR